MKNYSLPLYIPTIFAFFFCLTLQAQEIYTIDESKLDHFINEVYADKKQERVYAIPQKTEKLASQLQRVEIVKKNASHPKDMHLLSNIPVINTYNKSLKVDTPFDPNSFNPLKYKFDFFRSDKSVYYLVDNSDYVIVIKPQKK